MNNLRFPLVAGMLLASSLVSSMHPSVPQDAGVPRSHTYQWERTRTTWTEWGKSSNGTPCDIQGQSNSGNFWNDVVGDTPLSEHATSSSPTVDAEKTLQTILDNQNKMMHDLEKVLKHDAKVIRTDANDLQMMKHDAKGVMTNTMAKDINGLRKDNALLLLVFVSGILAVLFPVILGATL
jgi:hypothetical protein